MKLSSTGIIYGMVCLIIVGFAGYVVGAWIGLVIGSVLGIVLLGLSIYAYGKNEDTVIDHWTVEEGGRTSEKDRGQLSRGFYNPGRK